MATSTLTPEYHFNIRNAVFSQLEGQARRALYATRPDIWAKDILGLTLWSKQREIGQSVVSQKNTMVAAGHGVGKSYLAAALACWWIDTHETGEAVVLSTAPSSAQVRNILWRDIQKFHKLSKTRNDEYNRRRKRGESTHGLPDHRLPGYVTSSATWKTDDGIPIGYGRTPPRGREGDTFQGVHGNVFAIADEAVGVSAEMIDTLNNNTTADGDRRLLLANPTNPLSYMGKTWNDPEKSKLWSRIKISVFDSPKFTDEWKELPDDVLEFMTDQSYVDDKLVEYGEGSANYRARVLGEWASESDMILFTEDKLGLARDVVVIPDAGDSGRIGFDVSRSPKGDFSYLYLIEEGWVHETQEWSESEMDWVDLKTPKRTNKRGIRVRLLDKWRGLPFQPIYNKNNQIIEEGANERLHRNMLDTGAKEVRIDMGGLGVSMMDAMHNIHDKDYEVIPINGNDTPPTGNRVGFYNLRSYALNELSERMRRGEVDIDPEDSVLIDQLSSIEYTFASGYSDSMLIESKKEMRKKGLASPDAADAVWMGAVDIDLDSYLNNPDGSVFELDLDQIVGQNHPLYDNEWW